MNKKMIKIGTTIIMIVMLMSVAFSVFAISPKDIVATDDVNGTTEIQTVGQNVVGILQTVGIVLSVVVLIILGIKYMMGSAEEKAEYKKTMIPYIVGAALIFAASAFAQVIFSFFSGFTAGG